MRLELLSRSVFAGGLAEIAQGGSGYDVIAAAHAGGWNAVASWGLRGWDLGEWPYLVYFTRRLAGDIVQVVEYCEGDVVAYAGAAEDVVAFLDWAAFSQWRRNDEAWVDGVDAETVEDVPAHLRGAFSWTRAGSTV